jgi:Pectate lyase superfamily protein
MTFSGCVTRPSQGMHELATQPRHRSARLLGSLVVVCCGVREFLRVCTAPMRTFLLWYGYISLMVWLRLIILSFLVFLATASALAQDLLPNIVNKSRLTETPFKTNDALPIVRNGSTMHASAGFLNACANITAYGGAGDGVIDNTTAWAAALAQNPSYPCIYFPQGKYIFTRQAAFTETSLAKTVSIVGDGPDASELIWPAGDGISLTLTAAVNAFHIRDISIKTGVANVGVGLSVSQVPHTDYTASSTIDRVKVSGITNITTYWATGIKIDAHSQVNISSLDVYENDDRIRPRGIGLDLEAPFNNLNFIYNIVNSNFFRAAKGIVYGANVQGLSIVSCNFTLNIIGIDIPANSTNQAQLSIINSQFNNVGDNILFEGGTTFPHTQINNNLFFLVANTAGIHAVSLGQYAMLSHNQFITATAALLPGSQGIRIDANAPGNNIADDNLCALLATCIQLGAGSLDWYVTGTRCDSCTNVVTNAATTSPAGRNVIKGWYPFQSHGVSAFRFYRVLTASSRIYASALALPVPDSGFDRAYSQASPLSTSRAGCYCSLPNLFHGAILARNCRESGECRTKISDANASQAGLIPITR